VASSEKQPAPPVAAWLAWWAFYPFLWAWGLPLDPAYALNLALEERFGESDALEIVFTVVFGIIGGGLAVGCDTRDSVYVLLGGEWPEGEEDWW